MSDKTPSTVAIQEDKGNQQRWSRQLTLDRRVIGMHGTHCAETKLGVPAVEVAGMAVVVGARVVTVVAVVTANRQRCFQLHELQDTLRSSNV